MKVACFKENVNEMNLLATLLCHGELDASDVTEANYKGKTVMLFECDADTVEKAEARVERLVLDKSRK